MKDSTFTLYLQGGLGNQLFQACLYDFLRNQNRMSCRVNPSLLPGISKATTPRSIESEFLFESADLLCQRSALMTTVSLRLQRLLGQLYIEDASDVGAWRTLPEHPRKHLLGYFQDWTLVHLVWPNLQAKLSQSPRWKEILDHPLQRRITIHYRLGDYVNNPTARRHHGVTEPQFFVHLVNQFCGDDSGLGVVVVSDDPELCAAIFQANDVDLDATFSPLSDPLNDLKMIASSSHIIMSNSSFSWWGAWIAGTKGAQIVAPTPWFARRPPHAELIPPQWRQEERRVMSGSHLNDLLRGLGRDHLDR